jgi:hypothetical protein
MRLRLFFIATIAAMTMLLASGGSARADWLCARLITPSAIQPIACAPIP